METAVLYSGGIDSTLAALLLADLTDVVLVTGTFGVTDAHERARESAAELGLPFETVALDREVAAAAVDEMVADGYPRNGIQHVHEHALETVAERDVAAVADGTRRDDRVPRITPADARSLEDRRGVDYLAPLAGFGRSAIDRLAETHLIVETAPSEARPGADYETELRALLAEHHGDAAVDAVFPDHTQSRVTGLRNSRSWRAVDDDRR